MVSCFSTNYSDVDFVLESPQVWEARVFEFYQEGSSQEPTTVIRGQESYDAPNLRRRFFEEADRYNERDYYDNIYLHKEVSCKLFLVQIRLFHGPLFAVQMAAICNCKLYQRRFYLQTFLFAWLC